MEERSAEAVVREIYEGWLQGRSPRDLIDEDLEYVNPPEAVEPGTRRGRSALSGIRDAFDEVRVEPEDVIPVGDDQVLVLAHMTGRARGSGAPLDTRQGYLWTVRGGRAVRFEWFRTHEHALERVGVDRPG